MGTVTETQVILSTIAASAVQRASSLTTSRRVDWRARMFVH
jgi:hypothetical protein